ncbi:MAG TPA: CHAT domain-containing protein [Pyrinomonadaceae bacterium]
MIIHPSLSRTTLFLLACLSLSFAHLPVHAAGSARAARGFPQDPKPRKPLPKPPAGSRGFEQGSRDASSRLIAAGATRGPLKPIAPYEGLAYDARPFFAWAPSPGAASYRFTLRAGADSGGAIVYETDVKSAQFSYPADAPALTPGQLYSWRVSTAGVLERRQGPIVTFFVLAGEDAAQVKAALEKAKLTTAKTAAERLAQARIFEDYGVWYDALRIASGLAGENPNDAQARDYYDSLIKKLQGEAEKTTSQDSSAFPLWQQLRPLLARSDEAAAREVIKQNPETARALYRELLFENASAKLYDNPALPLAETARKLLAEVDDETRALETHFDQWSKERKLGVGFTPAGAPVEQMIYLAQVAELRRAEKDPGKDAPPGTPRELITRALGLANENANELAVASFSLSLSVTAVRERRMDDIAAPLEQAEPIAARWNHPVALFQIPLIRAYAAYVTENWKDAATNFSRAAELAKAMPELRGQRINALSMLATVARNTGDKQTTLSALATAVEEQQQVLKETTGDEARLKESQQLASLQTQLGGALAALGKHVEAGEWYVRAERLQAENYATEKAQIEKNIADTTATIQSRMNASTDDGYRKTLAGVLETFTDGMLIRLDSLASARDDMAEVARIAQQRLALAKRGGDQEKIAHATLQVANAHRKAGDYAKAKSFATEALSLRLGDPRRRRIYEAHFLLGQIADDSDDWNEALAQYRKVIEQTRPGVLPPIYDLATAPEHLRDLLAESNNLDQLNRAGKAIDARVASGRILGRRGNYRDAGQEYQTVLDELPRLYAAGAPDEPELLNWLRSNTNAEVKSVDVAVHRRQVGFTPDQGEEQRFNLASLMVNGHRATILTYRAMLFEDQNDLDNAVKAYEQSNALSTNLVGGAFSMSGTYVALARIERERGNYAAAEPAIDAALAEFVRRDEAWGIANMLAFKSMLRRDQGRMSESRQLAEDALKLARPLGLRSQTAGILRTLGRTESDLGGDFLKSSEQHLRDALAIWRDLGLRGHVAYTLDSLGVTLERLGRGDEALAAYIEAVGIVESLVSSLSPGVNAETFNASRGNRDLYDHLIKLLIKRGRAAEALSYLERSKSKALVDALAGANVQAKDPAVSALLDQLSERSEALRIAERELATELAKPEASRDQAKIAAARAKLERAQTNYLGAVETIKRANPSHASLVAVNPTDLVKVRKSLPEKTLLLEYFPTDNELYIFVVTRDAEPAIRTVPIKRADLAQLVIQYREALDSASEQGALERSARGQLWKDDGKADFKTLVAPIKDATLRLYDVLIKPAQAEVDQSETVIFVPAAELYYLPMHALGRANPDGSLSFLIEQKRFAYLASADLLNTVSVATTNKSSQPDRPLLALGNPDGSLPAATEEVSTLGKMFVNANVVTGKDATMALVARSTAGTSYVHFATHGFINSMEPKESHLLLAGDPGRLSVKDLVEDNFKLSFDGTRLVTLSACETNLGGFDPSAVYSSLSRAFAKAGAPTVIASLWSVNDVSTKETMQVFYKELVAGQSKAESLRRAQLAVMRDPRFAHPYFWAPFVVLGDWR